MIKYTHSHKASIFFKNSSFETIIDLQAVTKKQTGVPGTPKPSPCQPPCPTTHSAETKESTWALSAELILIALVVYASVCVLCVCVCTALCNLSHVQPPLQSRCSAVRQRLPCVTPYSHSLLPTSFTSGHHSSVLHLYYGISPLVHKLNQAVYF